MRCASSDRRFCNTQNPEERHGRQDQDQEHDRGNDYELRQPRKLVDVELDLNRQRRRE
jgi:hypothetical protein